MRFFLLLLPLAFLLTGCANEGTVVRKDSNPMPFYHSLGIDGSYKLALRDSTGAVRSQLVTPEVYQGYARGDYFNDAQPPIDDTNAAPDDMKDAQAPAPIGSGSLATRNSGGGNQRVAANKRRVATTQHLAKAATRSIGHPLASVQQAAPVIVTPTASPVVTAHFSVAMPPAAPSAPAPHVVSAKISNAPRLSVAATSAPKFATTSLAAAPVSRRSYHVAANTTAHAIPSSRVALVTQKPASISSSKATPAKKSTKSAPKKKIASS